MSKLKVGDVVDVTFYGPYIASRTRSPAEVEVRGEISAIDGDGILSITVDDINSEDCRLVARPTSIQEIVSKANEV